MGSASPPPSLSPPLVARPGVRLGATIGTHSVIDAFSFVIVAVMPLLQTHLGLSDGQKATLLALGSICSGAIQPLVAWLSDRLNTRWFGTVGFLLAVGCVSVLGRAQSFEQLVVLQIVATAGVGAYHPTSAACAGELAGRRRSLGNALFFMAGMLGGIAGNLGTPAWMRAMSFAADGTADVASGLNSMAWFLIPGVLGAGVLIWAVHPVPHRHHDAHARHAELSPRERRTRWGAMALLYWASAVRFTVNVALVYLYTEWAEAHVLGAATGDALTETQGVHATEYNGPLQASMQVGMGGFALVAGLVLRSHHEKAALVILPILGALGIAIIPLAGYGGAFSFPIVLTLSVVAGVGFGGVIPVSMSLAQRLLPHRTGLASGLMLGGAWSVAAVGPVFAKRVQEAASLEAAFYATGGLLMVASILAAFLPGRLLRDLHAS